MADLKILGSATRSAKAIEKWALSKNVKPQYASLIKEYEQSGNKYGVMWDVAYFQSCLETGWFWINDTHFDVDPSQNNFAGLGATGGGVPGDSFATPALGVEAQIQDLALRCGVKIPVEQCLSAYVRKVYSIISARGSVYWKDLVGTWAMDPKYWTSIQSIMADFDKWLLANPQPVDPTPVSDKDLTVTWFEFNRRTSNGESTITAYAGDTPKYTHKVTTILDLWAWAQHFPNAQNCPVADTATKVIPKVPDFGEVKPIPKPEPVTHDYVPFSLRTNSIMPVRATKNPKYLIWHWTCGSPDSTGEDTISWGKSQGYTYAALDANGQLWQSVKTTQGGYHTGEGIVDSTECYGVEVICAGKVEKINGLYVPWFAKKDDGTINKARCIPESEINYDPDNFDGDHSFQGYYHAFTSAQINTILRTCLYFMETYNMPIENIRDHAEVARPLGRKTDIGFSYKGGIVKLRKDVQALWDSGKRWNNY